jgi:hypothetical protein
MAHMGQVSLMHIASTPHLDATDLLSPGRWDRFWPIAVLSR